MPTRTATLNVSARRRAWLGIAGEDFDAEWWTPPGSAAGRRADPAARGVVLRCGPGGVRRRQAVRRSPCAHDGDLRTVGAETGCGEVARVAAVVDEVGLLRSGRES